MSNKLCSEPKYNVILNRYVSHIRDESYLSKGNFPIYEEYSIRARNIPFYVYDNEVFAQHTTDTAFTNGEAVFIYKDFFKGLIELDQQLMEEGKADLANNVTFILMHEIAHIYNGDMKRLSGVRHPIPNIAQDIANNQTLFFDLNIRYDIQAFSNKFDFDLLGLSPEEAIYRNLSSETIAIELVKEALALAQQQQSQSGQQQSQSGPSNSSLAQQILDALMSGQGSGVDNHTLDHNQIAKAAEEAGLSKEAIDRLSLEPRSVEETLAIEEQNKLQAQHAASEMQSIYDNLGEEDKRQTTAGTVGGYYKRKANIGKEGQITWKVAVTESFDPGNSYDTQYTEDVLIDEFYSNNQMFEGVNYHVQHKPGCAIFLTDTSGSMPKRFIDELFTEALASVDLEDPTSGFEKILLFPADVDVKDVYWDLTADNKDEVIAEVIAYGGGGTDFTNPIKNALLTAQELDLKVHAVIFGTDLDAPAPRFDHIEDCIEADEIPPVIFITNASESKSKSFEDKCKGYAVVHSYSDDLELVLSDINEQLEDELSELQSTRKSLFTSKVDPLNQQSIPSSDFTM